MLRLCVASSMQQSITLKIPYMLLENKINHSVYSSIARSDVCALSSVGRIHDLAKGSAIGCCACHGGRFGVFQIALLIIGLVFT
jgi:hypothetical protein